MFDRKAHCQRIAAHGGSVTAARHGSHHMRAIGRAGAQATIKKHGVAYFQGIVSRKGWQGRRPASLSADLAAGRALAALAASLVLAVVTGNANAGAQEVHTDPRIAAVVAYQSARYPAPDGCETVGGWEDGSIVAYCADTDAWLSHGPDRNDGWTAYNGPVMPLWIVRAGA